MGDVFRGESHHALVHRLHGIGHDISDRMGEGFLVDVHRGQVAGKKIFRPDHGPPQDFDHRFLHRRFERQPLPRLAWLRGDGKHLLDEIAGALEGTLHFIQAHRDGVVGAVQVFRDGEIADDISQNLIEIAGHPFDQGRRGRLGRGQRQGFRQLLLFRHIDGHQQDGFNASVGIGNGNHLGLKIDPAAVLPSHPILRLLG
jgi:hypothetical protein